MNISVNGQSQIPPGFRFHPTEEELLHYYLRKKVASEKIDLDVIGDVDLNKLEPWDIQEKCRIGSAPQSDWYFFSHKDRKYPTGSRTNRATAAGFWKATGRDKVIYSSFKRIGMRKTLVFYKGRAPHGQKSDWIMHEYRLDDSHDASNGNIVAGDCIQEEGWVICRVFKKKNYHHHHHHQKTLESPQSSFPLQNPTSMDPQKLDQILEYMGRSCKQENNEIPNMADRFMHLPRLESAYSPCFDQESSMEKLLMETDPAFSAKQGMSSTTDAGHRNDWVSYDRLVASQLNGEDEHISNVHDDQDLMCFPVNYDDVQLSNKQVEIYGGDDHMDLWTTLTRSSSSLSCDPLCHLSV